MILRRLDPSRATASAQPRPAFEVFLDSQKNVPAPFAFVLQIAHSELAGELAKALLPEAFGELPPEVAEAAWKHDFGWEHSDAAQTARVPETTPKPFPEVPDDELRSWREGLRLAEAYPRLTRILIGRHYAALANQPNPRHDEFLTVDAPRLAAEEQLLPYSDADLTRFAGAVGVCDLLSLLLCSGTTEPATFPLAHPASRAADTAPQLTLTWTDGKPTFSQPLLRPNTHIRIEAQRLNPASGEVAPLALEWHF